MKKNPFKKKSIIDTAINVGIGGAANVAIDYAWEQISALRDYDQYKDLGKVIAGALIGSMVSNRYLRAAADGIATVGVSDFIRPYFETNTTTESVVSTEGLPRGTVDGLGRIRYGARNFRAGKRGKIAGDFIAAD